MDTVSKCHCYFTLTDQNLNSGMQMVCAKCVCEKSVQMGVQMGEQMGVQNKV